MYLYTKNWEDKKVTRANRADFFATMASTSPPWPWVRLALTYRPFGGRCPLPTRKWRSCHTLPSFLLNALSSPRFTLRVSLHLSAVNNCSICPPPLPPHFVPRLSEPGRDCRRRYLSATRRPPVSTTPVTVGDVHQYATCLLSSYQHDSWSSVAESSPRQNFRTFSSVLFNCNSKTAARLTPTFLKRKVAVLYLQTASSRAWWYRLCRPGVQTVQADVRRADAEVKFSPLRTIDALVSDVSVVRVTTRSAKNN